jgi:guanylate kinase
MKASRNVYVFSGPSGAGKSTIIKGVKERVPGLGYSISHTTRMPRGEEKDGVDYHFVERSVFKELIGEGDFAEWAEVYGDYYGTSFSGLRKQMDLGLDVIMDVDPQGAENIRKSLGESSSLIYILPPSLEVLEKRLRQRGTDSEETIKKRIDKALKELANCSWYDYIIFNEDLQKAIEEAASIVISERCRKARQLPEVLKSFPITPL